MRRCPLYLVIALAAVLAPVQPAAAVEKPNQSDWDDICVNPDPSTWGVGGAYTANETRQANCRVLPRVGRDQRDRRYVVSVPKSALERRRAPVVVFFHGTTGTGEQYWQISRWKELAERRGFIAVFPTALGYDLNTDSHGGKVRVFNIIGQACDLVRPGQIANDVAFTRAIVRDLRMQLRVDRRRIYAAGFSNGGEMVHRLAAEAGDVFAAGAAWAGLPAEGNNKTGDESGQCPADTYDASPNPIPVWNGFGSKDDRVHGDVKELPLEPDEIEARLGQIFADASLLYSVTETHSRELALDDFVTQPRKTGYSPIWSPVLVFDALSDNEAVNEYYFVVLEELGHHYPNAWPGRRNRGATEKSVGVSMAVLQYQWFLDNPKRAP
jgi:poly(3-hydroxybutyrate) depolymerase